MSAIKAEVLRAVKMRVGSTLDGAEVTEITWVSSGVHEFDAAYVAEHRLIENGHIAPVERAPCCS